MDGQADRQNQIQHDKHQVIKNGVAQDHGEVPQAKEVLKILKANPRAVDQSCR